MIVKRLNLKGFTGLNQTEITFQSNFTVLVEEDKKVRATIVEAMRALLFGVLPEQRRDFIKNRSSESGNGLVGSLLLRTVDNKDYLIGRDFIREQWEIFQIIGLKLIPCPSTTLMDILSNELSTLNPLDFEALFVFKENEIWINRNSPGIREQLQKLSVALDNKRIPIGTELIGLKNEKDNIEKIINQVRSNLGNVDEKLSTLTRLVQEKAIVEQQLEEYRPYEPFLSDSNQNLLEELSRQLTAVAMERNFYEEQFRGNRVTQDIIRREIDNLRKKLSTFDKEIFRPEYQERVRKLVTEREKKAEILQKLQNDLQKETRNKGFLSRIGGSRKTGEDRIAELLNDLSVLRHQIEELTRGRSVEEYLREAKEYHESCSDLYRLEHPQVGNGSPEDEKRLQELMQQEKDIRDKLESLLDLAGSQDLKILKMKVNTLKELRVKMTTVSDEISQITGGDPPEKTIARLKEEREQLAAELDREIKSMEERERKRRQEMAREDPLLNLYCKAGEYLRRLTGEKYSEIYPEINGLDVRFKVKGENTMWLTTNDFEIPEREVVHLAFRLSLVRHNTPVKIFPLILDNAFSSFDQATKERAYALLRELSQEIQIILLLSSKEELALVSGDSIYISRKR